MPPIPGRPDEETALQKLIDSAKNKAFKRGSDDVEWGDIWLSLIEIPEYAHILLDRGVSVDRLANDLRFIEKFGLGEIEEKLENRSKELIYNVLTDIKTELDSFVELFTVENPDRTESAEDIARHLNDKLLRQMVMQGVGDDYLDVKKAVMNELLGTLAVHIAESKMGISDMSPQEQGIMSKDLAHGLRWIIQDKIALGADKQKQDPVQILQALDTNPISQPSSLTVVEAVQGSSGALYKQLLYRNGQLATDPNVKDELKDAFPSRSLQTLALNAVSVAYDTKSKTVERRHFVTALLNNWEVGQHLSALGIRDLLEFQDRFLKEAFKDELKSDSNIRFHPEITGDFVEWFWAFNDFCEKHKKDTHLPSKLLRRLLKDDDNKDMDKLLFEAGLQRKMLRGWTKPYPAKTKEDDEDKKDTRFKVSDEELNVLIGKYCTDYTRLASQKKFDPMIGNEGAMEKVTTTLLKRGKKNPILIGEPGVGKTKGLEGLAMKIVKGDVPSQLIGAKLFYLDLHAMNDTPFAGVFESRIKPILEGISERNASGKTPPMIIALDEFGNQQDAGAHSKGEGAKGLIKPYLTSGDLMVVGTTTLDEFRQKIEKDPALGRRFQPITLNEPTDDEATKILSGLRARYSSGHGVRIRDEMLPEVSRLAGRYIQGNHPDVDIDLLDTACAIAKRQGDKTVNNEHLLAAVEFRGGPKAEFLRQGDNDRYANLQDSLRGEVLDQDRAVDTVSAAVQRAKMGFKDPETPIGSFLFVGPTGVGKTELSRALARQLHGDDKESLLRYDMSEFADKHSVARFVGSPPGYVGYDEGGGLVNDLRNRPHSVVLFDEVEKAHPDVFNILLGGFSNGFLKDGRGMQASMRETIDILTSNLGASEVFNAMSGKRIGFGTSQSLADPDAQVEEWYAMAKPIYEKAIHKFFRPEFINRLDAVVFFKPLSATTVADLTERRIGQTREQLKKHHGLDLELSPVFQQAVAAKGYDIRFGARPLGRAVKEMVETPLSRWLLEQNANAVKRAKKVILSADGDVSDLDVTKAIEGAANEDQAIDLIALARTAAPKFQFG